MSEGKKMFLIRIILLLVVSSSFAIGVITFDPYEYKICTLKEECVFSDWRFEISKPIILTSIFIFIILFFSIFISNTIFKKWLKFTGIWLSLTALLVIMSPIYSGGWVGFGLTKELSAIWMGSLFVIISLIMFVVLTIREKRKTQN